MKKHSNKKATRKAAKPQWSVGLDLGDRTSRYAIVDEDGERIAEGECRNTLAGLAKVFGKMPPSRVAALRPTRPAAPTAAAVGAI